jgi:hypothetical protein
MVEKSENNIHITLIIKNDQEYVNETLSKSCLLQLQIYGTNNHYWVLYSNVPDTLLTVVTRK